MDETTPKNEHDPEEIQEFLRRLSRDKHAFGAHMGIRVDRDYTPLQKHEEAKLAAKEKTDAKS